MKTFFSLIFSWNSKSLISLWNAWNIPFYYSIRDCSTSLGRTLHCAKTNSSDPPPFAVFVIQVQHSIPNRFSTELSYFEDPSATTRIKSTEITAVTFPRHRFFAFNEAWDNSWKLNGSKFSHVHFPSSLKKFL